MTGFSYNLEVHKEFFAASGGPEALAIQVLRVQTDLQKEVARKGLDPIRGTYSVKLLPDAFYGASLRMTWRMT